MPKKFIVVTGGVMSGLGKGILSATLARLLKECGFDVSVLKIDPYLNVDAGTMNPNQHGEVFVTEDGYEADLDLGHYERFLGVNMSRENNLTAGQVYLSIIEKERKGEFLGATVQMVPHVTDEIKRKIRNLKGEVAVVEIGGTVGDIESEIFLEAVRQMKLEVGPNLLFVHVTFVPFLKTTLEFKTKPTQQSVQALRKAGIVPDFIFVRSERGLDGESLRKIALFGGVPLERVINIEDTENVYEIPEKLHRAGVHRRIATALGLNPRKDTFTWEYPRSFRELKIAIVGKYISTKDAYKSIIESIFLCGVAKPEIVDCQELEDIPMAEVRSRLRGFNAIIIPGGFGKRGIGGKIKAIRYARENKVPILGICLGMQLMVVEFARNVLGLKEADSTEFNPDTPYPVVCLMEEQKKISKMGGTMRLGAQRMEIYEGTLLSKIYGGRRVAYERHRHRYEANHRGFPELFKRPWEKGKNALVISAFSDFVEAVEIEGHPFFLGVQFHPEFKSRVGAPHPIFKAFVEAAESYAKKGLLFS